MKRQALNGWYGRLARPGNGQDAFPIRGQDARTTHAPNARYFTRLLVPFISITFISPMCSVMVHSIVSGLVNFSVPV